MNRKERRANGVEKEETILTISPKHLDLYMPHVSDGDYVSLLGKTYHVRVIQEVIPEDKNVH